MKKLNIKAPLSFRLAVILLSVLLVTLSMVCNLYARYTSASESNSNANTSKISYKIITPNEISRHQLDTDELPDDCKIVAVDEAFTLENDGEVAYNYTIQLTLTDTSGQALQYYQLTTPSSAVWLLSDKAETSVTAGRFYYYRDGTLQTASSPTVTGSLEAGQSVTYLFYYFIDFNNAGLDREVVIKYNIRCEQVD